MKYFKTMFLTLLILLISTAAFAAVPHLINYQGRLTDASGNPLTGSYNVKFRIYDAESAGNLLWQETQTAVVVDKGLFGVLLGSVTALSIPFDQPYFLEIKVGEEVMSPRQRITSAGYAIRAEVADSVPSIDPGKVGTKTVDENALGDGKVPVYRISNGKLNYEDLPKMTQVNDQDVGTAFITQTTFLSVNKTITPGKTVLLIASGWFTVSSYSGRTVIFRLKHGSTVVQTVEPIQYNGVSAARSDWTTCAVVTGLSGSVTFSVTAEIFDPQNDRGTAYGNLIVLEF